MTSNSPHPTTPDTTIVLIHGLWLTPLSWEHWVNGYEDRGYRVIAPTWPGMDAESKICAATRPPWPA